MQSGDRWLVGFSACCTASLAVELLWPHGLESSPAQQELAVPAPEAADSWQPNPLAAYDAIVARPLFTVDRRPFVPPTEETEPVSLPPGPSVEFELTAIVTSAAARMALLKTSSSAEVRKVTVGQAIDGWTLVEVREDGIVLRNGTDVRVLELATERAQAQVALERRDRLAQDQR